MKTVGMEAIGIEGEREGGGVNFFFRDHVANQVRRALGEGGKTKCCFCVIE